MLFDSQSFLLALLAISASVRGFSPEVRNAGIRTSPWSSALRLHPEEGEALVAAASEFLEAHKIEAEKSNLEDDLAGSAKRAGSAASVVSASGGGGVASQNHSKPIESFAFARSLFSRIVPKSNTMSP